MDECQQRHSLLCFIFLHCVFLSLIQYSDADCSITTSGVHTFGSACKYMCHCKNGEPCNTTTGECTSGCDQYWFGPGCQYRDLAEKEFSRHASNLENTIPQYSDRGNDGNTTTCSYTKEASLSTKIPWWRVVLRNEVTITDIYILTTQDGLKYFPGFEVTVEKLPYADKESHVKPSDTSVCYKHGNTVPDSTTIHVTCTKPLIGNQVRITLSKEESQLIVCDFRINQGRNIAFRQSVTSSAILNNRKTYRQASFAVDGSVSNTNWGKCFVTRRFRNKWLQVEFDHLMDVYYFNITKLHNRDDYINNYKIYDTTRGKKMLFDSGSDNSPVTRGYLNENIQTLSIEKKSGDHMAICELELYGDCPLHQCGYDCSKVCHCKTLTSLEDKISGICSSGCEGRWTGDDGKCDRGNCARNKWGTSCQNNCGACRREPCDFESGKCKGGCQDGYYNTDDCNTECNHGSYGYNCQNICSENCYNSCNKINGTCLDGCKPGYTGDKCGQECSDGSYGNNCENSCSKTCKNSCNKRNGNCIDGCTPGYLGDKCKQECSAGKFGLDCGNTCSVNCDVTCHHVSGTCKRCKAGYNGTYCDAECDEGSYGYYCRYSCSKNCKNGCVKTDGKCVDGCIPGYFGNKCEQECYRTFGQDCKNKCNDKCIGTCHHVSGTCSSCKAGWKGTYCDTECDNGTYGIGCSEKCIDKCLKNCDKVNGRCTSCAAGWYGGFCENKCRRGRYGLNCHKYCNRNCEGICNHVTGKCTQCKPGWKNDFCDQECDDGSYGTGCSEKCTDKCLTNCDKVNGRCTTCTAGWYGKFCEKKCQRGRYGLNCHKYCNHNCEGICNHVTGKCAQCKPGWKNDFCDQECDVGRYGHNCENSCSKTCKNSCNKKNGNCMDGCVPGYLGDTCEQVCPAGKFGLFCRNTCHDNCDVTCNHMSGICAKCQAGWKGDYCDSECEDGSYGDYCKKHCGYCYKNTACDKINGTCIIGCDSGYEGSLCTSKIVQEPSPGQSLPVAAIAGVSSALVVVVVIIVAIVFIVTRRRSGFKRSENTEAIGGNETERNSVSDNAKKNVSDKSRRMRPSKHNETVYENTLGLFPQPDKSYDMQQQPTTSSACTKPSNVKEDVDKYNMFGNDPDCNKTAGAITLNELTQYVKSKLAKVDFFDNEFQDIPYGLQHPTLDATKPVNIGKNRYKDLYAYDHSRVVLKTLPSEPNSDYINATYIKGYKKDRAYIAAQGPTETNKNEFWRMIWENNVNVIAMVTKLIEETKMKCVQYWATKGNRKTFGKVTVFTESEEEFAEYSIRHLKITYDGETRERNVIHYIYTAWPDKFIPNSTCSLLYFWQKVRKHDANKTNPWLVHCSAGVGRTGTFISIDYLYDQGIYAGFIDINTCVRQLRNQRVNMVQMKDQYRYLYRIMIEALILPSTPVSVYNFASYFGELLTVDKKTRRPRLKLEFELMSQTDCLVKDSETQEYTYKNAKLAANKTKNRYNNILAPDEYRPFLSTNVPGTTNYINAVYMPSYSDLFSYIIAQSPLPDTAVDCCRLIIEQDIHLVVTFEDVSDNEVGIYLPRKDSIKVGPFEATLNKEEIKDGYILRRHTLKFKSREHEVIQVVCQNWLIHEVVPEDPSKMLQILLDTRELQRQNENKPVMLQCLNGAERSGLFVVLMNIIERVCKEEEVSILLVVRYLRTRRQQIVPNYEQYKFCHDVLLSYIETNSTYANL